MAALAARGGSEEVREHGSGLPSLALRAGVVERTFAWLCRNRRLAKDFETHVENATAYITIAMIKLLTRRLARV